MYDITPGVGGTCLFVISCVDCVERACLNHNILANLTTRRWCGHRRSNRSAMPLYGETQNAWSYQICTLLYSNYDYHFPNDQVFFSFAVRGHGTAM